MIVDASAVVAILFATRDAEIYACAITQAGSCKISAASFVEVSAVVEAQTKEGGSRQLDAFIRRAGIVIEPVREEQAYRGRRMPISAKGDTP